MTHSIRASRPSDADKVVEIWRRAVDATHDFLLPEDRASIDLQVQEFLPQMALWLAVNTRDEPLAFMAMEGSHIEALFVNPDYHRQGVGHSLMSHALAIHPVLTVDVNEQNDRAVAFYERLGFIRTGRSDLDGEGRPYPLIHLRLATDSG